MANVLPEEVARSRAAARLRAWLLICFGLGLLLTNYPFLHNFNQPASLGGLPLIFAYLLGVWLLGIFILFLLTRALSRFVNRD